LITITCRLAKRLRTVFRLALNLPVRGSRPPVRLEGGPEGLHVYCRTDDAIALFHLPGEQDVEQFWLPHEALAEVEGNRDEPVHLRVHEGNILVGWRNGSVPQMLEHPVADSGDQPDWVEFPANTVENPPELLGALHEAMRTTDSAPVRFATNCVRLRGSDGTIAATDGHELLIQSGFEFPWEHDVLVPRTLVFGCKELTGDKPVHVGRTGEWIGFRIGSWSLLYKINADGRFPQVENHVPCKTGAAASFELTPDDAEFLVKNLAKLPTQEECNWPVTVDMNGHVAVRGKAPDQAVPTELMLDRSTVAGEPMRINTNRRYLARAVRLGFRELYATGSQSPVLCCDDRRKYVWAPLDPESAVAPDPEAMRTESSLAWAHTPKPRARTRKRKVAMPSPRSSENGQSKPKSRRASAANGKAGHDDVTALIEQAEALKGSLRESLVKVSELISSLKQHRRQSKAVRSALASLRELQPTGAP